MLASDAHEGDLRVFGNRVTRGGTAIEEIAVQTNPVHVTSLEHLLAADDGDIVLGLAGRHAGVATRARVEVDRHAPLLECGELVFVALPDSDVGSNGVGRVLVGGVSARRGDGLLSRGHVAILAVDGGSVAIDAELGEVGVLLQVFDIAFADDVAAFHGPMVLHVAHSDGGGAERELHTSTDGEIGGGDERIDVEAVANNAPGEALGDAGGDTATDAATEAELQADGKVRHARHDEERTGDGLGAEGQRGDSADETAVDELVDVTVEGAGVQEVGFTTDLIDECFGRLDGEFGGELGAGEDHIFPDRLGHGIRSLSEPAVVGILAVTRVDARDKTDFEGVEGKGRSGEGLDLIGADSGSGGGEGGTSEHPFGEPGGEGFIGRILRQRVEGLADERVRVFVGTGERSEDIELGDRREQRVDHRLHGDIDAAKSATVGPALEVM